MLHRMRWLLLSALVALTACSTEGTPQGTLVLSIRGLPEGASPSIVLKGPKELVLNGPGSFPVPVGTYTLEARDVVLPSGERYYAEQVTSPIEVKRGQKANAEVVYALDRNSLPGELVLLIEGLPKGAEAAVSVEGGGQKLEVKASGTLRLKAGTYLVRASRVSYGGRDYLPTPAQASVDLEAGSRKTHTVSYAPEVKTGELLVNITGLPSGTEARVRVLDGSGTSVASLTKSRLLSLPAGTYFVEADPVGTYVPQVSGSPANVQAGARAEVQVVYENQPQSLSLTLNPTALTVPPGSTGTLQATLQAQNFSGQVSLALQGEPSGVTIAPTSASAPGQVFITLSVASSVAPGTYPITLQATGQGVSASAGFSLVIPQPDFTFSLSPQSVSVSQGQSATLLASVSPQNGFSGQISFSLVNPPAGFSLSGGPVSPNGPTDVPLVLSVGTGVAPGTYSLVVKAEGGGVSRTQTLSVQVSPTTGQLALSILFQGAPAGTEGHVVLSGPNGDQVITRSQVLTLAPGTYTITAYSVSVDGVPYAPSPPGGTVEVVAGGQASFTVTYTPRSGGGAP